VVVAPLLTKEIDLVPLEEWTKLFGVNGCIAVMSKSAEMFLVWVSSCHLGGLVSAV